MIDQYKIERLQKACNGCQKEFHSGDRLVSAVTENDKQELERVNLCRDCWPKRSQEVFSYWDVVYPRREKPKIQDMDKVQKFFDRILKKPEPQYDGVRFFTALVLMRKKRVRLLGTGGAVLKFEKSWDGEIVEIPDPGVTEEKLAEIRAQMEQLFEMEFQVTV
jgi:hypothetical protein